MKKTLPMRLSANFATRYPISHPKIGEAFFERMCTTLPEAVPTHIDFFEPQKSLFSCNDVAGSIASLWTGDGHMVLWKRRRSKPLISGWATFGNETMHYTVSIRVKGLIYTTEPFTQYLMAEAEALSCDFSHLWIAAGDRAMTQSEAEFGMSFGFGTRDFAKGLADIPWASVFGPCYVEMFSRDKLLSAPCAVCKDLGEAGVYVQLTASAEIALADPDGYKELQARVRSHLGDDAFWVGQDENVNQAAGGARRIPRFEGMDLRRWGVGPPAPPRILGYVDGLPVTGIIAGRPIVDTGEGPKILDIHWLPSKKSNL